MPPALCRARHNCSATNWAHPCCPCQADLAGKDFAAEREHVVVISTGAVAAMDHERLAAERAEAEERHRHQCVQRCL